MKRLSSLLFIALLTLSFTHTLSAAEAIPEQYRTLVTDLFNLTDNKPSQVKKRSAKKVKKAALKRKPVKKKYRHTLRVKASAYNSLRAQTDSTPNIAAWGDRLKPGMKIIAVSRDLLTKYGMKHNTVVKIKGLSGTYRVADKMNKRYRKTIDIYMGKDRRKAMRWGRKTVTIMW